MSALSDEIREVLESLAESEKVELQMRGYDLSQITNFQAPLGESVTPEQIAPEFMGMVEYHDPKIRTHGRIRFHEHLGAPNTKEYLLEHALPQYLEVTVDACFVGFSQGVQRGVQRVFLEKYQDNPSAIFEDSVFHQSVVELALEIHDDVDASSVIKNLSEVAFWSVFKSGGYEEASAKPEDFWLLAQAAMMSAITSGYKVGSAVGERRHEMAVLEGMSEGLGDLEDL